MSQPTTSIKRQDRHLAIHFEDGTATNRSGECSVGIRNPCYPHHEVHMDLTYSKPPTFRRMACSELGQLGLDSSADFRAPSIGRRAKVPFDSVEIVQRFYGIRVSSRLVRLCGGFCSNFSTRVGLDASNAG